MGCEQAREALSARLDGEEPAGELGVEALDAHLARCVGCRQWLAGAESVGRAYRLREAPVVPDLSERVVERVLVASRGGVVAPSRRLALARLALLVVALGQLAVAAPALVLGTDHGAPLHVAHELGALKVSLAAGFVFAAARPLRALGVAAVAGVAAAGLLATAGWDLAAGATTWLAECPHLLVLAGVLLTAVVARTVSPSPGAGSWPTSTLRRDRAAFGGIGLAASEEETALPAVKARVGADRRRAHGLGA